MSLIQSWINWMRMIIKNVIIIIFNYLIWFCFCFLALSTIVDDKIEENVNRNSGEITPMESDQQISTLSRSHMDDDIVEIEGLLKNFIAFIILSKIF